MSATAAGGQMGATAGGIELHSTRIPRQLRLLEPLACLAVAAHGFAVQLVAAERAVPLMLAAVAVLTAAGVAGLLGWRAPWAVILRLGVIVTLGFVLMALGAEGSGYILLWYFVVVAVYPLVLPQGPSRWVAVVVPAAYLLLVPLDAADGPLPVALLRAVALAVIAMFVHTAATAFREAVADRDSALVTLYTFAEATPVGLGFWDRTLRARWLNTALAELSDLSASEHVGRRVTETLGFSPALAHNLRRVLATGRSVNDVELEAEDRMWTSTFFPVNNGAQLLGVGAVVIDVTEQREASRALTYSATHDALTGLPNRALFGDRLEVALAQAERTGALVAVLVCGIDRFKMVNDSLGHSIGDAFLRTAAERLADVVRQGDTVARIGGDEFALLCTEVADIAEARSVGERVCSVLREPIQVDDRLLTSTMSVGVAIGAPGQWEAADLMRDADVAMYQAKDTGRDRVAVFDVRLRSTASERLELHSDLRAAVAEGQITVAYQPVIGLRSSDGVTSAATVVGLEALARWWRPGHGDVPPASFIPLAEDLGLIHALGEHVMRTACAALAGWREQTGQQLVIAVNMSALQLADPGCVAMVRRVLDETGLPPAALELEITESILMLDVEQSLRRLANLRALGVSVAIDDFGTGYSSLAYLRDLPVDVLKIDRSFTSRLPDDQPMFAFVVELARAIGAITVVEGVETDEQYRLVGELGCDQAQGYFMSRPLKPAAVRDFLGGWPSATGRGA